MKDIKILYDRWSKSYDKEAELNPAIQAERGVFLELLDIKPKMKVLDIGCGTGRNIPFFLKRNCKITAVDISPKMIDVVKSKFDGEVNYKVSNFLRVNEKYDIIIASISVAHIKDLGKFYYYINKHLNKNGQCVFDDFVWGITNVENLVPAFLKNRLKEDNKIQDENNLNWSKINFRHTIKENLEFLTKNNLLLEKVVITKINQKLKKFLTTDSYENNKGKNFTVVFKLRKK